MILVIFLYNRIYFSARLTLNYQTQLQVCNKSQEVHHNCQDIFIVLSEVADCPSVAPTMKRVI